MVTSGDIAAPSRIVVPILAVLATLTGCRTRLAPDEPTTMSTPARRCGDGTRGFRSLTGYGAGSLALAIGVAAGDFDSDGAADLLVTGRGGIDLLHGSGHGGFGAPRRLAFDEQLWYPEVADLDGDRLLDVAVAGSDAIHVLRGDGAGGFADRVTRPVERIQIALRAVDLDGDRRPELILTNGPLSVYSVGAQGALDLRQTVTPRGQWTGTGVTGDFTGDGWPDLLIELGDGRQSLLLAGLGDGTLAEDGPEWGAAPSGGWATMAAGDFDGDSRLDAAVAAAQRIEVRFGDGTGAPGRRQSHAVAEPQPQLAAADLSRDGLLDLVLSDESSGQLTVLLGRPGGSFEAAVTCDLGAQVGPQIAIADFDGDTYPDLALTTQRPLDAQGPYDVLVVMNSGRW